MRPLRLFMFLYVLLSGNALPSYAQETPWVMWNFKAIPLSKTEVNLLITATLAPGWHIYPQHLAGGGPPPTQITYTEDRSYQPLGGSAETGNKARFYSDILEMYIEWYSDTVTFSQRVTVYEPVTVIRGTIEYMTCNEGTCIPDQKEFAVAINLLKP